MLTRLLCMTLTVRQPCGTLNKGTMQLNHDIRRSRQCRLYPPPSNASQFRGPIAYALVHFLVRDDAIAVLVGQSQTKEASSLVAFTKPITRTPCRNSLDVKSPNHRRRALKSVDDRLAAVEADMVAERRRRRQAQILEGGGDIMVCTVEPSTARRFRDALQSAGQSLLFWAGRRLADRGWKERSVLR